MAASIQFQIHTCRNFGSRETTGISIQSLFRDQWATLVDIAVQQMLFMLLLVDLLTYDLYRMVELNCLPTK